MPRFINLINKKFGQLVVDKYIGKDKYGKSMWLCICDCGRFVNFNKARKFARKGWC